MKEKLYFGNERHVSSFETVHFTSSHGPLTPPLNLPLSAEFNKRRTHVQQLTCKMRLSYSLCSHFSDLKHGLNTSFRRASLEGEVLKKV